MDTTTVEVPGGKVWVGSTGAGRGTPLLTVHGGPGFPHNYLLPLERLGTDRRVVFYDQLGCGLSDRPGDPGLWTLERSLEELDTVRRASGLDEFHLFGSSWGGLLAIQYALTRPAGLTSLVLSSPLVSVPSWNTDAAELRDALPEDDRAIIADHERKGNVDCPEYTSAVLKFWKRHVCRVEPWPDELEAAIAGAGTEPYRTMWGPSEFTQTGNLKGIDPSTRLHEITVPVLWSCGRYDEARPHSTEQFADMTPNGQFRVFEESSHMPHFEEPDAYHAAISEFLQRVDKAVQCK